MGIPYEERLSVSSRTPRDIVELNRALLNKEIGRNQALLDYYYRENYLNSWMGAVGSFKDAPLKVSDCFIINPKENPLKLPDHIKRVGSLGAMTTIEANIAVPLGRSFSYFEVATLAVEMHPVPDVPPSQGETVTDGSLAMLSIPYLGRALFEKAVLLDQVAAA
jgi:hypothetical protein